MINTWALFLIGQIVMILLVNFNVAPNNLTSGQWQQSYPRYFVFIFLKIVLNYDASSIFTYVSDPGFRSLDGSGLKSQKHELHLLLGLWYHKPAGYGCSLTSLFVVHSAILPDTHILVHTKSLPLHVVLSIIFCCYKQFRLSTPI